MYYKKFRMVCSSSFIIINITVKIQNIRLWLADMIQNVRIPADKEFMYGSIIESCCHIRRDNTHLKAITYSNTYVILDYQMIDSRLLFHIIVLKM